MHTPQGTSQQPVPGDDLGGRRSRVGLVIALAVGVGFIGLLGVRVKQAIGRKAAVATERAAGQERAVRKEPAKVVKPTSTKWVPFVGLLGTLKPWRDADVGFETSGHLVRVGVSVGDKVASGQVLAVLDASRAAAEVHQAESQTHAAEANLALAQDHLRRTEALVATKAIPEAQAEQARQQVALAKAQLEGAQASTRLAKTNTGLTSVSAPFAGVVTKAPTGIGSVVNPGTPLIHLEDISRFRLSGTLNEEEVQFATVGAPVKLLYQGRIVDGKVIAVVMSLDQATRRAPVEIEVPNPNADILAWSFVRARILGQKEVDAVRVPALARKPGSQDEIVTVVSGRAKVVKTAFAVDDDGTLVVHRGLTTNDQVLLSPNPEIQDGDPVDESR